jgi:hypothetical protein
LRVCYLTKNKDFISNMTKLKVLRKGDNSGIPSGPNAWMTQAGISDAQGS